MSKSASPYVTTNTPSDFKVVYVTVDSKATGEKIAEVLVREKAAACVNIIGGITSVYTWQDKVEKDAELLLMIKTRAALVPKVTQLVQENHTYELPEVITVDITGGSKGYLEWIATSTDGIV